MIKKIKEGGWIPVYQQKTGITTVVKTSLPETRLVGRFYPAIAAPPVSHHLNQRLPVSLFSHSQRCVQHIYYSIKKEGVNPL